MQPGKKRPRGRPFTKDDPRRFRLDDETRHRYTSESGRSALRRRQLNTRIVDHVKALPNIEDRLQKIAEKWVEKAEEGDPIARRDLVDRLDGPVKQVVVNENHEMPGYELDRLSIEEREQWLRLAEKAAPSATDPATDPG